MNNDINDERFPEGKLLAAIIECAVHDAKGKKQSVYTRSARRFLSLTDHRFNKYCFMLSIDPEWLFNKIWVMLNNYDKRHINVT